MVPKVPYTSPTWVNFQLSLKLPARALADPSRSPLGVSIWAVPKGQVPGTHEPVGDLGEKQAHCWVAYQPSCFKWTHVRSSQHRASCGSSYTYRRICNHHAHCKHSGIRLLHSPKGPAVALRHGTWRTLFLWLFPRPKGT